MIDPKKTITVAELIEQLRQLPQHMIVQAEGCDCIGKACGASVQRDVFSGPDYVLIERTTP